MKLWIIWRRIFENSLVGHIKYKPMQDWSENIPKSLFNMADKKINKR